MICPHCTGKKLREVSTRKGILVEHCDVCEGTWLDKGELFMFTRNPRKVAIALEEGIRQGKQGDRPSPKTGRPMKEIPLFSLDLIVDYCEDTKGLWFDRDELDRALKFDMSLGSLSYDPTAEEDSNLTKAQPKGGAKDGRQARKKMERLALIASRAKPLPNLLKRSLFTLVGLYALVTLVLITASLFAGLSPVVALTIGFVFAALQFLLGPFLMDLCLNWFYALSWPDRRRLPEHLVAFLERVCAENRMKFPRIGLIHDGAPNAFTYGHTPNNARIVITRGLMELLTPEELEAVVAHEAGHAKHWDMAIMTMANLVPLVMYYIYRTMIHRGGGGRNSGGGYRVAVAVGAYILYIVSEYIVLWFSRTREYYADRFGGKVTEKPNTLASALVKIAYGLAGRAENDTKDKEQRGRSSNLEALGALGIFDAGAARALAVSSVSGRSSRLGGEVDKEHLKGAMRWDRWNPWAKYYELHSTHPLVANRLEYLSEQAALMGQEPYVVFTDRKPESYWDEFLVDLFMMWIPAFFALPFFIAGAVAQSLPLAVLGVTGMGLGMLVKTIFSYKTGMFPEMNVASLLKYVKVSSVRPVPCTLRGTIIGRGVPGLVWSEDFVLQDESGIMFLDYRQPLRIWEFFFGLLRGKTLQNQSAVVTGWYRRSPIPYLEIKTLEVGGVTRTCYVYAMRLFVSVVLALVGIVLMASL